MSIKIIGIMYCVFVLLVCPRIAVSLLRLIDKEKKDKTYIVAMILVVVMSIAHIVSALSAIGFCLYQQQVYLLGVIGLIFLSVICYIAVRICIKKIRARDQEN